MRTHITDVDIEFDLQRCNEKGLISKEDQSIVLYDFDILHQRIKDLKSSFPPGTIHTSAIKTNPLLSILNFTVEKGLGLEAASMGELILAEKTGLDVGRIVFDSPAKTKEELEYALKNGVHINADNFIELERINEIHRNIITNSRIGLRINPQVGIGKIESTSVAGEYSKFGVPIERAQKIIERFKIYPWLKGLHIHIGSQACNPKMLLDGLEKSLELINEIKKEVPRQIEFIDIGGGIPISYHKEETAPDISSYGKNVQLLLKKYGLSDLNLITEFGRYLHVNAGYTISKVEYLKEDRNIKTAIIHLGADMFVREALQPQHWSHDFSVISNNYFLKKGFDDKKYNLAGPLCFAGDFVAKNISLPKVELEDYIVIHDSGGYTFSMWSRYLSRQFPKIIGIEKSVDKYLILKGKETPGESIQLWI